MKKYRFKKYDETKSPASYLVQAESVLRSRGKEYGHFLDLFRNTARRMSMATGKDLDPYDVARIMIELKLSRLDQGGFKEDTILDIINYCALAGSIKSHMDIQEEKKGNMDFSQILNVTDEKST